MKRSLLRLKTSKNAQVRIMCFPFAGGNAAFVHNWSQHLPSYVELLGVQYPGRDGRSEGALLNTPQSIVDSVFEEVLRHSDMPLIFFGYSLGALIAYETSKQLAQHSKAPSELVVAAARAPHIPRKNAPVSTLPDNEFIAKLRSYGGTPESVLQNKNLLGHFLPILRADFATAENYRLSQFTPLSCPITALAGSSDRSVDESAVAAWEMHTSGNFVLHRLEGGHFFLHRQLRSVISIIQALLERHVDAGAAVIKPSDYHFDPQGFGS